jgi:protein-tyrosine phosphatase
MSSDQITPGAAPGGGPKRSILFVCTGNTCRSPLAEVLCRKMLADRLGVGADELAARGFAVGSAGVAALVGDEATPEAAEVARELGADLAGHRSQPVTPEQLAAATDVIAMTAAHAQMLAWRFPGQGPAVTLLSPDGDLPDPFGSDLGVYRECARSIQLHLDRLVKEWVDS